MKIVNKRNILITLSSILGCILIYFLVQHSIKSANSFIEMENMRIRFKQLIYQFHNENPGIVPGLKMPENWEISDGEYGVYAEPLSINYIIFCDGEKGNKAILSILTKFLDKHKFPYEVKIVKSYNEVFD